MTPDDIDEKALHFSINWTGFVVPVTLGTIAVCFLSAAAGLVYLAFLLIARFL